MSGVDRIHECVTILYTSYTYTYAVLSVGRCKNGSAVVGARRLEDERPAGEIEEEVWQVLAVHAVLYNISTPIYIILI
jgi:hypothetical protein